MKGAHPPPLPIPSPPQPEFPEAAQTHADPGRGVQVDRSPRVRNEKQAQMSPTAIELTSSPWTVLNPVKLEASVVTQAPVPPGSPAKTHVVEYGATPRSLFQPGAHPKDFGTARTTISEDDLLAEDLLLEEYEKASAGPRRVESLGTDLSVGTKGFRVGGLTPRGSAVTPVMRTALTPRGGGGREGKEVRRVASEIFGGGHASAPGLAPTTTPRTSSGNTSNGLTPRSAHSSRLTGVCEGDAGVSEGMGGSGVHGGLRGNGRGGKDAGAQDGRTFDDDAMRSLIQVRETKTVTVHSSTCYT